jgi:hypothetical protein
VKGAERDEINRWNALPQQYSAGSRRGAGEGEEKTKHLREIVVPSLVPGMARSISRDEIEVDFGDDLRLRFEIADPATSEVGDSVYFLTPREQFVFREGARYTVQEGEEAALQVEVDYSSRFAPKRLLARGIQKTQGERLARSDG